MVNYIGLCILTLSLSLYAARTPHRGIGKQLPRITITSSNNPHVYTLTDYNLRPTPLLYIFDHEHFMNHLLPTPTISYEKNTKVVETKILNDHIHALLEEIDQKSTHYRHFTILKNSGFVRHKKCGLLIVKFNAYPFVLKLFIEPAKSFINPYDKGFEAANIFIMGGAIRHTLGFTRIKTLNYVIEHVNKDPYWHDKIITPRKWFWLPKKPIWLTITTHNLGNKKEDSIRLPAIYGIIADALEKDPSRTTNYSELMLFSKFLEHRIDPHTNNFFIEKTTGKIALIDTELFPVITGFNTPIRPHQTHIKWYTYLAGKYLQEKLFTCKEKRQKRQTDLNNYYLTIKK